MKLIPKKTKIANKIFQSQAITAPHTPKDKAIMSSTGRRNTFLCSELTNDLIKINLLRSNIPTITTAPISIATNTSKEKISLKPALKVYAIKHIKINWIGDENKIAPFYLINFLKVNCFTIIYCKLLY